MAKHKVSVDLFGGGGGVGSGLKRAGYLPALAIDFDEAACATYAANVGPCWRRDITTVRWQDITDHVGAAPDHLHFSPPCPDFSPAGHGDGWDGAGGRLMWEPVRLMREAAESGTLPDTISMENSSALVQERHLPEFLRWVQALKDVGYHVAYRVLDAADYGAPQHRKRVILLGAVHFQPTTPKPTHARVATEDLKRWISVRDAIGHLLAPDETEFGARRTRMVNGQKRVVTERTSIDEPSLAIRTASGGSSHLFICAGERERRATIQEVATLQTFPEGFAFRGAPKDAYRIIGNAVPPLMGEVIGRALQTETREPT